MQIAHACLDLWALTWSLNGSELFPSILLNLLLLLFRLFLLLLWLSSLLLFDFHFCYCLSWNWLCKHLAYTSSILVSLGYSTVVTTSVFHLFFSIVILVVIRYLPLFDQYWRKDMLADPCGWFWWITCTRSKYCNDPLFFQNSDHPGKTLVSSVLTGSNYLAWSRSIKIGLRGKDQWKTRFS